MSRITREALARAISKVRAMNRQDKEALADELFQTQPHLFGSFLVQQRLGVSLPKMEFLLDLFFVCFQAMKESGLPWPLITEDELDRQSLRFAAFATFGEGLGSEIQGRSMLQYVEDHPEKELLAFIQMENKQWLKTIVPEESDKYVLMATWNIVNCIAFVPMKAGRAGK